MSFGFSTSPVVGQTGQLGTEYDVQYRRYQKTQQVFGEASLYGNLICTGVDENKVLDEFERDMGYDLDSLSWSSSISNNDNPNNILFKDDAGNFAEIDFDKNFYEIKNERKITEDMGFDWSNGKPYSVMTLDQGGISFYCFTPDGNDGKQDGYSIYREKVGNIKWGLTSLYHQEINPYYLYANDDYSVSGLNGQYLKSLLYSTASQFMSASEILEMYSYSGKTQDGYNLRDLYLAQKAYTSFFNM